jgi:bacterioferritin-associated ferredoxin
MAERAPSAPEPTVVCRCEGVTLEELAQAASRYRVTSLRQLKLVSRAGMGICQARVCAPALEALARAWGLSAGSGELRTRPPIRPVDLATLAGGAQG